MPQHPRGIRIAERVHTSLSHLVLQKRYATASIRASDNPTLPGAWSMNAHIIGDRLHADG
jgi:hypothetical protein